MLFNGTAAILIDVAGVALPAAGLRRNYLPDQLTAGNPCDKRHHDEQLAPDLVRDRYISRHFLAAFDSFRGESECLRSFAVKAPLEAYTFATRSNPADFDTADECEWHRDRNRASPKPSFHGWRAEEGALINQLPDLFRPVAHKHTQHCIG